MRFIQEISSMIFPQLIVFSSCLIVLTSFTPLSFRTEQQKYPKVRKAYSEKESIVSKLLTINGIDRQKFQIYLRAFKAEKKIELWAKNTPDSIFKLLKMYDICSTSGNPSPKRREGDLQIPEGFYYIDRFNPYSKFYLSLGINYPNPSDKVLGVKGNLGGEIFIHGSCVTIGCMPITDFYIKELYVFCVEAKTCGQQNIQVSIFPARLDSDTYNELKNKYKSAQKILYLWQDLKKAYDIFNQAHVIPKIFFIENGRHRISQ